MRSYFHFGWRPGEHLILSRVRETGENKMHAETVLFSLVVCFAKSRWKRNKHWFLSLSILTFYVLVSKETPSLKPDFLYSKTVVWECVWVGGGAGWALWAQRNIQDKNHEKSDNFQKLRQCLWWGSYLCHRFPESWATQFVLFVYWLSCLEM